jgi:hypothetical protein
MSFLEEILGKHASEALGMTELPEVSQEERERSAEVQS